MNSTIKLSRFWLAGLLLLGLSLQGCVRDKCNQTITYMAYTPVYMSPDAFKNAVAVEGPRALKNPGKIFVQEDYLFVNEIAKGVHIFDNSDPQNPVALAFINAPGTYDLAVNCGHLYLDSSTDLLVFDLGNPAAPRLTRRIDNALPHMISYRGFQADPQQGIVVEWKPETKTVPYICDGDMPDFIVQNQIRVQDANEPEPTVDPSTLRSVNPAVPGKAGSMSRFAVQQDHLYVVTPNELRVYDASNCTSPALTNKVEINTRGGEAETIFGMDEMLLIGSTSGMFIYDNTSPQNPVMLSVFQHVQACDPVVSDGTHAYVTLRSGNQDGPCPGWTNQLDVINIENPANPQLVRSYMMTHPAGLGVDQGTLFVCDGDAGLKVFDTANPANLRQTQVFSDAQATDVIPNDGVLIMVGEDGIVQYNYDVSGTLQRLSTIEVEM